MNTRNTVDTVKNTRNTADRTHQTHWGTQLTHRTQGKPQMHRTHQTQGTQLIHSKHKIHSRHTEHTKHKQHSRHSEHTKHKQHIGHRELNTRNTVDTQNTNLSVDIYHLYLLSHHSPLLMDTLCTCHFLANWIILSVAIPCISKFAD